MRIWATSVLFKSENCSSLGWFGFYYGYLSYFVCIALWCCGFCFGGCFIELLGQLRLYLEAINLMRWIGCFVWQPYELGFLRNHIVFYLRWGLGFFFFFFWKLSSLHFGKDFDIGDSWCYCLWNCLIDMYIMLVACQVFDKLPIWVMGLNFLTCVVMIVIWSYGL